jgi:hypothetical protein
LHPSLRAADHFGSTRGRSRQHTSPFRHRRTTVRRCFFPSLVALLVGAGRRETVFRPVGRIQSVWKQRHQETQGCSTLFMSGGGGFSNNLRKYFRLSSARSIARRIAGELPPLESSGWLASFPRLCNSLPLSARRELPGAHAHLVGRRSKARSCDYSESCYTAVQWGTEGPVTLVVSGR